MTKIRYAKGPVVYLYDRDSLSTKKRQLLWGDWLRIGDDINAEWSKIQWGNQALAIRKKDYQDERLLELIFLDVGQGDGCILTPPLSGAKERILIVDAGDGNHMNGYLKYRFRDFRRFSITKTSCLKMYITMGCLSARVMICWVLSLMDFLLTSEQAKPQPGSFIPMLPCVAGRNIQN